MPRHRRQRPGGCRGLLGRSHGSAGDPVGIPRRFSYLGQPDPWRHEVILHLVAALKGPEANRSHVDITVGDVDRAISQIVAIGGRLKRQPSIYPRPHSLEGVPPLLDWAVVQDPFGNEFCLVSELSRDERNAVRRAALDGGGDDHHWRVAAGRATTRPAPDRAGPA